VALKVSAVYEVTEVQCDVDLCGSLAGGWLVCPLT
jgi:hypothetical protein